MAYSVQSRKEKKNVSVEIDRKKHKVYKIFAVKNGLKLKELVEFSLDKYIKGK